MAETEVVKLQKHLSLLREEYVKLQNKHTELERKYNLLSSIAGNQRFENNSDSFICRILKTISDLFDKDLYSDLLIKLNGHELKAHKFVLDARSKNWSVSSLAQINELDLTNLKYDIGYNLIKWVYTDVFDNKNWDENFYLDMMKEASRFELKDLKEKCEDGLLTFVNVRNCIKFYEVAEEISANKLKSHCNELISNHWEDFTSDDFAYMPAALLYTMFKSKTRFPLHAAIKAKREDVVFLYLIENDSILQIKLNEVDDKNDLPLDLALRSKQESIARNLVRSYADVNKTDNDGLTLLHKAIIRTDEYAALFLVENNIRLNIQTKIDKKTALMSIASIDPVKLNNDELMNGMVNVAKKILVNYSISDLNIQDSNGNTCLHIAINSNNKIIFKEIFNFNKPNMDIKNNSNELPLWLALLKAESENDFSDDSFASLLISNGCNINIIADNNNGDSLIHVCARKNLENSSLFLVKKNVEINSLNNIGESVLHLACENGLERLVKILLEKGSDPNVQTKHSVSFDDNENISLQTPMHRAILNSHEDLLELFIEHKDSSEKNTNYSNRSKSIPNFNLKDSEGQSILSLCIWNNSLEIAKRLIDHGADVNIIDYDGTPLLHQAILRQCTDGALFLLNQNVNLNIKSSENLSALQLAVKRHLPLVVENLCKRGADMSILDSNGNSPLWNALDTGQEDIATILVLNGCDTTQWSQGPDGCLQTLLHRAIDENNEAVSVFLIKSNCDINSPRRPGLNGETPDEAKDGMTPLHLACTWGQEKVVTALVEHSCEINKQDSEGNTPLHVAILNQNSVIIDILVMHSDTDLKIKNAAGQTPFAIALLKKNNKAASSILHREPKAAEQLDNKGRNFLHTAVLNSDIETVLLLLSVKVNINSKVQDSQGKTALHLAIETGSEMIVRNLLLAGIKINDITSTKKNALHLVAELNHSSAGSICQILLENGIDFHAVDASLNNALHIAVQFNNLSVVKVLLAQSDVNVCSINSKGMSPLHMLGLYGKDNSSAILDAFMQTIGDLNLNQKDQKGNTCLLLAYQNGNGNLCRSLVKYGAAIGAFNDEGLSVFNYPVATKQLLYKLLDVVSKEPPWVECETCLECRTKFSLTVRKHHCRHCGRVLCKKCSEKEIPILKFQIQKPVRSCDICFEVLTVGTEQNLYK